MERIFHSYLALRLPPLRRNFIGEYDGRRQHKFITGWGIIVEKSGRRKALNFS